MFPLPTDIEAFDDRFDEQDHADHHNDTHGVANRLKDSVAVFVDPQEPVHPEPFLWVQTGLGDGTDFTFWIKE